MSAAWAILRNDLVLNPGGNSLHGAPTWVLHDPSRNLFFKLEQKTFEILSHWNNAGLDETIRAIREGTNLIVEDEDVTVIAAFLRHNCLTQVRSPGDTDVLKNIYQKRKTGWAKKLLHNYLFIRIPLVHPDKFLAATYPMISWLYAPWLRWLLLILGGLGVFMVMREWGVFVTTMTNLFTMEGFIWFSVALVGVKVIHELAHAYTAHRYGCRVASLGVAFLVMWPVLYTDVTDAWKLPSRRVRMSIAGAGMVAEIGMAVIATFLWNFLPDGAMRTAVFLVATTTWIGTLSINLLPFLKFDGYFLFSDWLGEENLFQRSFAHGRWALRETLFKFGDAPPEHLSKSMRRFMIVFAWGVWVYRLLLFLGIAVLVYHFFFKLLGIFLFGVEIWWFVLGPMIAEVRAWWQRRHAVSWNVRTTSFFFLLFSIVVLVFVPWRGTIKVPAILTGSQHATLFVPTPSNIKSVHVKMGDHVKAGTLLAVLSSPELDYQLAQVYRQSQLLEWEISTAGTSGQFSTRRLVAGEELRAVRQKISWLQDQKKHLNIVSPLGGIVTEPQDTFFVGQWVARNAALFKVMDYAAPVIEGYVKERDQSGLNMNAMGTFYPDELDIPPILVQLEKFEMSSVSYLSRPSLAAINGGQIITRQMPNGALVPEDVLYRIFLKPIGNNQAIPQRTLRGIAILSAPAKSLGERAKTLIWSVLIRESGF